MLCFPVSRSYLTWEQEQRLKPGGIADGIEVVVGLCHCSVLIWVEVDGVAQLIEGWLWLQGIAASS